jgi:hypothetical protein
MTGGERAYSGYARERRGMTYDKRPMPPWDDLGDEIRAAWEAAARAVTEDDAV